MAVWAFNKAGDDEVVESIYQAVKNGKSRFGWSLKKDNNLKLKDVWTEEHSKQLFLLEVERGDWIVHINTPVWGECTAVQVLSKYDFDDGLELDGGSD